MPGCFVACYFGAYCFAAVLCWCGAILKRAVLSFAHDARATVQKLRAAYWNLEKCMAFSQRSHHFNVYKIVNMHTTFIYSWVPARLSFWNAHQHATFALTLKIAVRKPFAWKVQTTTWLSILWLNFLNGDNPWRIGTEGTMNTHKSKNKNRVNWLVRDR